MVPGCESLALLATRLYEDGKLDETVDPNLRRQMDQQSYNIFSKIAYHCLNVQQTQRPDMKDVVERLAKALEHQRKYENPIVRITSSDRLKGKNLEHLKIPLIEIEKATNSFSEANYIGSGAYGMVYKARLHHFDGESSSAIEGKKKNIKLPKKLSNVAIKRIIHRQDMQGEEGFFAEIEMLTSCKHPNIVSLLGFCDEKAEGILVYEHAFHGSLEDYLESSLITLTWKERIRMCLDIARGLNYLHTTMKDKERIIHRDIKSANILLYKNWEAKIADFGLSRFHPTSTVNTKNIAGTEVYLDPEYLKTGKLKKESDTYSFGVVLFEIMCGRLAYDGIYNVDNEKGLPSIARRRFDERRLKELVDPKIKAEIGNLSTLNRGPDQESFDTFSRIAYQCLAETQAARPTMEDVIKELEKALLLQENSKDKLKISLEDINLATQNFSDNNYIGRAANGKVYRGEVSDANGHKTNIAAKRLDKVIFGGGQHRFSTELEILFERKHKNVIGLVGYCDEMDEEIIVYEYASRGSLNRYLKDESLTWMNRLRICIDVANGLDFLHGTVVNQEVVIHGNINSSSILLNADWRAKLTDFGLSLICKIEEVDNYIDLAIGMVGWGSSYSGKRPKAFDIHSLGVLLFNILGWILAVPWYDDPNWYLREEVEDRVKNGTIEEMVFEGIREQIVPQSLSTYFTIAYQCIDDDIEKRPSASDVILQLKKALEFQEDYEIWEPKLPADYKQIIQMSEFSEIYSHKMKKDLYAMFSQGILLKNGKVWFSLSNYGERNEMISARNFSYKKHGSHKLRSISESRFKKVLEILDISNMKIHIKIRTQFLSPGVNYGVHLVFRFRGPRKSLAKQMYVNLKFKKGNESLNAYFATWREDGWMMIELFRFYNHKEETDFEVLLESFSQCYCGSRAIYVEGVEFRAIDNVKHEEIEKSEKVQFWKPKSPEKMIEFSREQVIHIKQRETGGFLPNTEYVCYFVFKLSEKCQGLHCPVIVRDLLHSRNKEIGIIYFRSPSPWNLHDTDWVPEKRKDGWMEVIVWKFNSKYELKDDCVIVNLKLISYEGTLEGLILHHLEFRDK